MRCVGVSKRPERGKIRMVECPAPERQWQAGCRRVAPCQRRRSRPQPAGGPDTAAWPPGTALPAPVTCSAHSNSDASRCLHVEIKGLGTAATTTPPALLQIVNGVHGQVSCTAVCHVASRKTIVSPCHATQHIAAQHGLEQHLARSERLAICLSRRPGIFNASVKREHRS